MTWVDFGQAPICMQVDGSFFLTGGHNICEIYGFLQPFLHQRLFYSTKVRRNSARDVFRLYHKKATL